MTTTAGYTRNDTETGLSFQEKAFLSYKPYPSDAYQRSQGLNSCDEPKSAKSPDIHYQLEQLEKGIVGCDDAVSRLIANLACVSRVSEPVDPTPNIPTPKASTALGNKLKELDERVTAITIAVSKATELLEL